jgi:hypothetical protein
MRRLLTLLTMPLITEHYIGFSRILDQRLHIARHHDGLTSMGCLSISAGPLGPWLGFLSLPNLSPLLLVSHPLYSISRLSSATRDPSTASYMSHLLQEATLVGLGAGPPATNNRDRASNGKRIYKAQPQPAPLDLMPSTTCRWPRVSLRLWTTLTSKPNVV